ncbi:MAG TPA: hypothetical protein VNA25_29450 [Phycisphaerae bacterium]|nr:hypothetical protein [Phycisphaerae bacterium]
MNKMITGLVVAVLGATALPTFGQDANRTETKVVRFGGTREGRAWNRPVLMLVYGPVSAGRPAAAIIPNTNPRENRLNPSEVIMNVVKELKRGDLIEVTVAEFMGNSLLRSVRRYDLKPGENEPNVFVFEKMVQEKLGRQEYDGIVVSKYGSPQTVLIPIRKNKEGKPASDEQLLEAARQFKEGDSVELEVQAAGRTVMLKSIYRYEPPKRGTFVRIVQQKVNDEDCMGIEIQGEDGNQVVLIPNNQIGRGKPFPDRQLAGQARSLRPGKAFLYKTRQDDKGTWLRQIRPAPREPATRPTRER